MVKDFLVLWRNRERPDTLMRCFKVWVKRVIHSFAILRLFSHVMYIRMRGASIGRLVVLGKAHLEGPLSNLQLGDETSLGRCHIALHELVSIGNRVVINDNVNILSASHSLSDPFWRHKKRPIYIGDYAWIATGAIILPGVKIGRGAVVGAGAVVRDNVPDYSVMIGNPGVVVSVTRNKVLSYSPVLFTAPFEAWVGPNPNDFHG